MGGVYDAGTGVGGPGDDEGRDRARHRLSNWDAGHHEDGVGMKFMMLIS